MKRITNYKETNYDSSLKKSVKEGIDFLLPEKEKVLSFFEKYKDEYIAVTCFATNHITGKPIGNSSILSYNDGVYCWTNEEIYLFDKYNLKLNDDFIQYVLNKVN